MKHVQFKMSAYMHELIKRIHATYPNQEWSGIARAEKKDWYYLVSDILFGDQENSWTLTTISEKGMWQILEQMVEKAPEHMSEYCVWLHSHHSMRCFWSGTDEAQKQSFNNDDRKHFFHIVTNYDSNTKEPWYLWALTFYKPFKLEFVGDVTVETDNSWYVDAWVQDSIDIMKAEWEASKSLIQDELITMVNGLKSQDITYALTDEMSDVVNLTEEDIAEIQEELSWRIESIRTEKINNIYALYQKKLDTIDLETNKKVSELLEACTPFTAVINDLKSKVNQNRKSWSPNTQYTKNSWKKNIHNEVMEWEKNDREKDYDARKGKGENSLFDECDPFARINRNHIAPPVMDDSDEDFFSQKTNDYSEEEMRAYVQEIIDENINLYRYDVYVDMGKFTPIPQWFGLFRREWQDLNILGWLVPLTEIYTMIRQTKQWE